MDAASVAHAPLRLAARTQRVGSSAIREILKVAERPDVLSFAGGLPAPELFPVDAIADAFAQVLSTEGAQALQYSVTEGYRPLREWISDRLASRGVRASADRVLVTAGAQQGIDLAARVLLDPGSLVAVENPGYLAASQVFTACDATMVPIASDDDGMRIDDLARRLEEHDLGLIYLVPDFQNPRGTTLSLERRHALVRLAQRHRVPILEDDPYGELRFRGAALPSLAALDDEGVVVSLGTFSKTLAPGLRLGWMHGPHDVIRAATVAKQGADLQSPTLTQRAAAQLLWRFDYASHVTRLRLAYGARCDAMLEALARELPPGTRWTRPEGGLFLWVELPTGFDADVLLPEALAERVAYVPGSAFYVREPQHRFLRLNFSNRSPADIAEGIRRLGRVVHAAS